MKTRSILAQISSTFLLSSIALSPPSLAAPDAQTHEAGRCAIRGNCRQPSFFTGALPCPDNGPAETPADSTRQRLVDLCGDKWSSSDVCCNDEQIDVLDGNLKKAAGLISSCPACKENFYNLFCTFTCSPDQSLFINVTETEQQGNGKDAVTELDSLWSDAYGSAFYDSCKDVKVGATGSNAMVLIGGGAKNYTDFLKFLGHKNPPFGSPFQINFPRPEGREQNGMTASDPVKRACNDSDPAYRCACVDCPAVCPELAPLVEAEECKVGMLPCLSFASVIVYLTFLLLVVAAIVGHVAAFRHKQQENARVRLLQDASPSDDEDEGDFVHSAGLLDRPQRNYKLNQICDAAFSSLGRACAKFPLITIGSSIAIVALLSLGWVEFGIEQDPVRLWVSPTSDAAKEKQFFDDSFGAFYRIEQAFLVNDTNGQGPVLSTETLKWWFEIERQIARITPENADTTLEDVCFNPTGDACVVQSISGYFPDGLDTTWEKTLSYCTESPGDCLPPFGQPLNKELILGGYHESEDVLDATAMITTWVVNNPTPGSEQEAVVMAWEEAIKARLQGIAQAASERGLRLSFTTEISLEEELNQSTNTDAKIVVISYVIMFIYASFALGSTSLSLQTIINHPANAFVRSKFSLGVAGIVIVLMSVAASVGLFSAVGIKSTLIIAEVIPFLILAVGVDNIFLIVHEFERVNVDYADEPIHARMARSMGRMGPSILLSGLTETITFALGIFVGMPAVRNFAIYATGAIVINALLQVTMFVSILALNQRRVESSRVDCFPCIKIKQSPSTIYGVAASDADSESWLQSFIRKRYAPALLNRQVKVGVIAVFLGVFAAGVALLPEIKLGLDQKVAIPSGSYLIPYFEDLETYFDAGPPVYFITRDVNVTARSHQQQLCGRFTSCESYSLSTVLEQESKRSPVSYITGATASWIDDFLFFLNPINEDCCTEHGKVCFANRDPAWNITLYGMPEGDEFIHYVDKWLATPTDSDCSLGGKAPYSSSLVINHKATTIPASYFRTAHTPLRTQEDFIAAYASARRIASDISQDQGIDVFPYSKFYIFFDQYSSIVKLTGTLIGSALALIMLVSSVLLGSLLTGFVVTLTVGMIIVDILGFMALANVSLNAVSLVNLLICLGIGVEFCAHIARAFMFPSRSVMSKAKSKSLRGRDARVWTSLVNVGGSVFSGITITKALGVFVLAFTRSKIFEIFYFRIWMSLVITAALHSLVWLPVVLSLIGGDGYIDPGSEGSLEDDLATRRYRALLPDDEYDSDDY